jgi:internalin A
METATPNATIAVNVPSLAVLRRLVADNNNVSGRIYSGWVSISGPITSLQGLQNCSSLSVLYLESNSITDLSPLAPLSVTNNLVGLHLDYNNGLSDLSPLSNLTGLQNLELRSGAAIGDVYFQGSLTDLSPVSTLTNLIELEFSAQPVRSLAPLANLHHLRQLFMIGDGSVLENSGYVGGVTVISSGNMPMLQTLYAGSRGISDISSLAGMTSLVTVDLNINPISDISPIGGWTGAQTATFAHDDIRGSLPSLVGLGSGGTALVLDLSENTGINDITNLAATTVPGLTAAGSFLKISGDSVIPSAQITSISSAYPNLAINGP